MFSRTVFRGQCPFVLFLLEILSSLSCSHFLLRVTAAYIFVASSLLLTLLSWLDLTVFLIELGSVAAGPPSFAVLGCGSARGTEGPVEGPYSCRARERTWIQSQVTCPSYCWDV